MRYYTADLHIGHANIITYCDRPFHDVDAMDEAIVDMWNDTVTDDDEIWVLGDLALGARPGPMGLASLLRGRKILVPGNHDTCWKKKKVAASANKIYYDAGFELVHQPDPVTLAGQRVLRSHFPFLVPDSDQRYPDFRPVDHGEWLLHGHIHNQWRQRGRMINVGLDAWGGQLVTEAQLEELITAGSQDLDLINWRSY